ncbi:hypothetical protein LR48_Vigan03g316500 [Vigna angularis]|uniref:Uncharacterized protein n=1 Tax=Phaseolus angularis TaxID=3914 RepID=A0A0L9UAJ6_PHAAN|nr:hypothetical protein LR48_Vigan03g316500 [Vigna angularis]
MLFYLKKLRLHNQDYIQCQAQYKGMKINYRNNRRKGKQLWKTQYKIARHRKKIPSETLTPKSQESEKKRTLSETRSSSPQNRRPPRAAKMSPPWYPPCREDGGRVWPPKLASPLYQKRT